MPSLHWIGKEAVVNHHHAVPFHLLRDVPELSVGESGAGNLIVQGDNLVALKALLPYYAGQVKCIYIDPPYNTGNEGWAYNDNVNSPTIRRWLGQVVGKEGETLDRHDRWLCMMYPRLALLRQFLREDGAIFVSLDDNEIGPLRSIMDEVFGAGNFATTFIWEKRTTRENRRIFSFSHDFVVCYAKNLNAFAAVRGTLPLTEDVKGRYENPDDDPRGAWQSVSLNAQAGHGTADQFYTLVAPGGRRHEPPKGRCWTVTERRFKELAADNRVWFGKGGTNAPRLKKFLRETTKGLTPHTLWRAGEVGTTDSATKSLMEIFCGEAKFDSPKPAELIERILQIATNPGDLILDSFAGSGTTGHAVLKMNAAELSHAKVAKDAKEMSFLGDLRDLGVRSAPRRFILVEMESNIARDITAERVKRVAQGYTNAKGEQVAGLGGGFRFCELGEPLFDETGKIRASVRFADLARHVYFTETGEPLPELVGDDVRRLTSNSGEKHSQSLVTSAATKKKSPLLGIHHGRAVCLLYNGILKDKSVDGGNALTQSTLALLRAACGGQRVERLVVYGTSQRLSPARLKREGVTFKQIPYSIRIT